MKKADSLTIREAQETQPWTVPYAVAVDGARATIPHILGSHTVLHAAKSVGKLAAVFEALDHADGRPMQPSRDQMRELAAMSADLLTAALRIANLYHFDLATTLIERVQGKNNVVWPTSR